MWGDALCFLPYSDIRSAISAWHPLNAQGYPKLFNLYRLIESFIALILRDTFMAFKITILLSYMLVFYSSYAYSYYILRNRYAATLSSMLFGTSRLILAELFGGHYTQIYVFSLFPLLLLYVIRVMYTAIEGRNSINDMIKLAIIWALFLMGSPLTSILVIGVQSALYCIVELAFISREKGFIKACKIVLNILASICIGCVLSSIWFASLYLSYGHQRIMLGPIYQLYHYSKYSCRSLFRALILMDITPRCFFDYDSPLYIFAGCIYVLLSTAILLILDNKDDRTHHIFSLIIPSLIGVILSTGPNPPFGEVNIWIFTHVPGFSGQRVGSRWLWFVIFSHSFIISYMTLILYNSLHPIRYPKAFCTSSCIVLPRFKKEKLKKITTLLISALIVVCPLIIEPLNLKVNRLEVYNIPSEHSQIFNYIKAQRGNFAVMSIPFKRDWIKPSWSFDNIHDLYSVGSYFHSKYTFTQPGPFTALPIHVFLNHIIRENLTQHLGRIIGLYNVRYLVVQSDAPEAEMNFVTMQRDLRPSFHIEGNYIFENEDWLGEIYATSGVLLVVGGLKTFLLFAEDIDLAMNSYAMVFANTLNAQELVKIMHIADAIVFYDTCILDLIAIYLQDDGGTLVIPAYRYVNDPYRSHPIYADELWTSSSFFSDHKGDFTINRYVLYTRANVSTYIPFTIKQDDVFEIWIRTAITGTSRLKMTIDGHIIDLSPYMNSDGFLWLRTEPLYMNKGSHEIRLDAVCIEGEIAIDELLVSPRNEVDDLVRRLSKDFRDKMIKIDSRIIHDRSGMRNDATIIGYTIRSPGVCGFSIKLAPFNYVILPDVFEEWNLSEGFSIELWAKIKKIGKYVCSKSRLISRERGIEEGSWSLLLDENTFKFYIRVGSEWKVIKSLTKVELGKWYHLVITYNGSSFTLYVNGLREGTLNLSYKKFSFLKGENLTLGAVSGRPEHLPGFLNGYLDEVRIYSRPINEQEIRYSFRYKVPLNSSGLLLWYDMEYPRISKVIGKKHVSYILKYSKVNPWKYEVIIRSNCSGTIQCFIILTKTFHTLWKAHIEEGRLLEHTIVYGFLNGYYALLSEGQEVKVSIVFYGQYYLFLGGMMSVTSFIVIMSILILRKLRERSRKWSDLDGKENKTW